MNLSAPTKDLHEIKNLLDTLNIRKMLDENGLLDIGYIGLPYNWFNNRTHIDAVSEFG